MEWGVYRVMVQWFCNGVVWSVEVWCSRQGYVVYFCCCVVELCHFTVALLRICDLCAQNI